MPLTELTVEPKATADGPVGLRRGWLTLVSIAPRCPANLQRGYKCVVDCDCGKRFKVRLSEFNGAASCGCIAKGEANDRLVLSAIRSVSFCCEDEQWKWAVGFESYVLISTCGRVFSLHWRKVLKGHLLHTSGYPAVYLSRRKPHQYITVHSMVLLAFRGPAPAGMQARHLDGNRTNSHLRNLKWGTIQENADDRRRHGTLQFGEAHPRAVLTEELVRVIRQRHTLGHQLKAVARELNLNYYTVLDAAKGNTWTHVA